MSLSKVLAISAISLLFLNPSVSKAQGCTISVTTEVRKASHGKSDGEISIKIKEESAPGRFKVFLINKGQDSARNEISNRKLMALGAGVYEFIIVDTAGDKCFKELSVTVVEN